MASDGRALGRELVQYSPGLEYLTYALLAPFGLALDIRFCRVVNVLVGMAAALSAAVVVTRAQAGLRVGWRDRAVFVVSFCTAMLLIFNSPTSDGPHPDNLHMLQATASLLLCHEALRRHSPALTVLAIAVAGLGVVVKQPAALGPIGSSAAFVLAWKQRSRNLLPVVCAGLVMCAFASWFVLADANRRFFILDLPAGEPILYRDAVARLDTFLRGHRLPLSIAAPAPMLAVFRSGGETGRSFLLAWFAIGATEAAPSIMPALKVGGIDNNFTVMALWLLLLDGPVAAYMCSAAPELLDRAITAGEAWFAGRNELLDAMRQRLAMNYYDRLYFVGDWLPKVLTLPEGRYRKVNEIPAPGHGRRRRRSCPFIGRSSDSPTRCQR